jgi:hypothetical protein
MRNHHHDPLTGLGHALASALIAQVVNVLLAAVLAAQVPGGYRVRSAVFVAGLSWSLAGTILLLIRTSAGSGRGGARAIGIRPVALWLVSAWVWPILVHRRRRGAQGELPTER